MLLGAFFVHYVVFSGAWGNLVFDRGTGNVFRFNRQEAGRGGGRGGVLVGGFFAVWVMFVLFFCRGNSDSETPRVRSIYLFMQVTWRNRNRGGKGIFRGSNTRINTPR